MKTYKVQFYNFGTEDAPVYSDDVIDLVNVQDSEDRIWASPEDFTVGETITEEQFYKESRSYVDDQGAGSAEFAFKK